MVLCLPRPLAWVEEAPPGEAYDLDTIEILLEFPAPLLEDLVLPIRRSKGDTSEAAIYRILAGMQYLGADSSTGLPKPGELQSFGSDAFKGPLAYALSLHANSNISGV